ncbi:hypothetical protein EJV46_14445 [Roseococcus sp. SYP-B2431]|uniref:DUF6152 family protein n=1 Tax=Roseococcus sp. SYP-B2431 TaxID=2496640 RepID=UPI00103C8FFC|nr:hypothetical protein EJV46_14445 [Roseococcus sp. SYP-B2431]
MPGYALGRRATLGSAIGMLGATAAAAHHGWSWADDNQTELRGTIREVYIGQPHPTLRVETADGLWIVELGNPQQTQRSGFTAESAAAGDNVVALGNRSRARNERRMKAVRLTVRGRAYDIYPERIRPG